jgi:hypothetical protein
MFTITHIPSDNSKSFESGKDAYAFYQLMRSKKISAADIKVDNTKGVALTAYDPRIGETGTRIIEQMEERYYGNNVPEWHWIPKKQYHSSGLTTYNNDLSVKRVTVSAGTGAVGVVATLVHEFAHALAGHKNSHNRTFYRTLFKLWQEFIPSQEIERKCQKIEENYIKSSRYWYAEYHGLNDILAEYGPRNDTANVLSSLFS